MPPAEGKGGVGGWAGPPTLTCPQVFESEPWTLGGHVTRRCSPPQHFLFWFKDELPPPPPRLLHISTFPWKPAGRWGGGGGGGARKAELRRPGPRWSKKGLRLRPLDTPRWKTVRKGAPGQLTLPSASGRRGCWRPPSRRRVGPGLDTLLVR